MINKKVITTIVIIAIFSLATISATYAYFKARIGAKSATSTNVTSKTIDQLTFKEGEAISLSATQSNFTTGSGDLSSSTSPSVILKSRNDGTASYNYEACLSISQNTFVHSQISSTETSLGRTVNLFDYKNFYADTSKFTITDGVVSGLNSNFHRTKYQIPEELVGKTLTFSADLKSGGTLTGIFIHGVINGTAKEGNRVTTADEFVKSSMTFTPTSTSDYIHISYGSGHGTIEVKNIQLEVGSKVTPYDQYGYIANPDLVLTVTKNGTTVLTQDITHGNDTICMPTTNGGTTTTHTISASNGVTKTDEWKATVTFKNYTGSQNANLAKSFRTRFYFTKL